MGFWAVYNDSLYKNYYLNFPRVYAYYRLLWYRYNQMLLYYIISF